MFSSAILQLAKKSKVLVGLSLDSSLSRIFPAFSSSNTISRSFHDTPVKREPVSTKTLPTVAIIGRTNVGKSALFNRLVGKRRAIVNPTAGTTRDRNEAVARISDLDFIAIDTPGFEGPEFRKNAKVADDYLQPLMMRQTAQALEEATVAFFVVDAKEGVTQLDENIAKWLRKRGHKNIDSNNENPKTPIYVIANKADNVIAVEDKIAQMKKLGFGDAIPVSALNGFGISSIFDVILENQRKMEVNLQETINEPYEETHLVQPIEINGNETLESDSDPDEEFFEEDDHVGLTEEEKIEVESVKKGGETAQSSTLRLTIVGRPNVGKSTLINAILGEERVLVGPMPGVTRDSIDVHSQYKGKKFILVDTAGVRRKTQITEQLEIDSVASSLKAIHTSDAVVLMTDVMNDPLSKQDLRLANEAIERGKILVVVINKYDLMPPNKDEDMREWIEERIDNSLSQIPNVPLFYISANSGTKHEVILDEVLKLHDKWSTRISTSKLNRWLRSAIRVRSVPRDYGKLRYMTQITAQPPTFVIFQSGRVDPPESYMKYLTKSLRDNLNMDGIPIKVQVRHSQNPYAVNDRRRSPGKKSESKRN